MWFLNEYILPHPPTPVQVLFFYSILRRMINDGKSKETPIRLLEMSGI